MDKEKVERILQLIADKADDILKASDASLTDDTTPNSSITDTSSSSANLETKQQNETNKQKLEGIKAYL